MKYDRPLTKADFETPILISDSYEHVFVDGVEMTAENIWNWPGDRSELVERLVDYFHGTGFVPWKEMSDADVEAAMLKLRSSDSDAALGKNGDIMNSSRLCLDVCRAFCRDSFYATRVNGTPSILDVYADKGLLRKVLKNRMGWYTTTEPVGGVKAERPYLFDISHKMVVQGAHSSMVSANVSNFRPLVAKFLMARHCRGKRVLDLSAGWCARFLAAWSLGFEYFGIDPMTAADIGRLRDFIVARPALADDAVRKSVLVEGVSEDPESYDDFPSVDYVIACPPYFGLEQYACDENSASVYPEYRGWLAHYWRPTVANAVAKLMPGGRLTLIMVEAWKGHRLLADMSVEIEAAGCRKIEELSYKTTRSHLTDKRGLITRQRRFVLR